MRGRRRGVVHLVGAGPGDPDLITLRGRDLLARADVVIADALVAPALLRGLHPGARVIAAGPPGGRRILDQERINRLMISLARRGRVVVRLKGGDPNLFGRGGEEAEALARSGIRFTVVPGVTAALGAAATAGIPLTHRRHASTVAFATGHLDPDKHDRAPDWKALAGADTLVLYMGVERLSAITRALLAAGRDPAAPAALVRWATRPDQDVVTGRLATIAARALRAGVRPPALLFVGEVARLRRRLDWFGRRPLNGRTIVVTRPREQIAAFAGRLEEQGARVLAAPAIALRPPRSWAPLDRALRRLEAYRYVIFTSPNGVARFFERLTTLRLDIRRLAGRDLIAIGPATAAALEQRGLRVAAVPEEFRAEGVARLLKGEALRGRRVLIPRAAAARDLLPRVLAARGARVDVVPVYRTVPAVEGFAEVREALRAGAVDLVAFASSSAVEGLVRRCSAADRRRLRAVPAAVIGPITAATARRHGLRVVVRPRRYTIPALAEAILRRLRNSPSGTPRGS